jgi:hypothetical protein
MLVAAVVIAVAGFSFFLGAFTGGGIPGFGATGFDGMGLPSFRMNMPGNGAGATTDTSSDGAVSGTVQSIGSTSMVVQLLDGSTVTVDLTGDPSYHSEAGSDDIHPKVGSTVIVKVDVDAGASPGSTATGRFLRADDVIVVNP